MLFDDEKNDLNEIQNISVDEDGTVTWEDVLSGEDDTGLVSIKEQSTASTPASTSSEFEFVQTDEDEANDDQLSQILHEQNERYEQEPAKTDDSDDSLASELDDIDLQLQNLSLDEDSLENDADTVIRKNQTKNKSGSSALIIALIFAIFVAGGVYYGMTYFSSGNFDLMSIVNSVLGKQIEELEQLTDSNFDNIQEQPTEVVDEEMSDEQIEENKDIPVVNDDELDTIKAEEKPKEEKKQIVNVIATGRNNPFMPIPKYISATIPETSIDYSHTGIPKPPEKYAREDEAMTKMMSISVSGIMYDPVKPSAIITFDDFDYFVQKGDKVDDYAVVDITKNYVSIALGKNIYQANIGEEFRFIDKFEGNAHYLTSQQGQGRHYHSAKSFHKEETGGSKRYVSEDDVEISIKE